MTERKRPVPPLVFPTAIPTLEAAPSWLTLARIWKMEKELGITHRENVLLIHGDMSPDVRDLPHFFPVELELGRCAYTGMYENEMGRVEEFIVVIHAEMPRFDVDGVPVYPVIAGVEGHQVTSYHIARSLA